MSDFYLLVVVLLSLPLCFLLLITPPHRGDGKLDFDFYLWMSVPDTRAVSQDINLYRSAFSLIYCLRACFIWLTFVLSICHIQSTSFEI